MNTSSKGWIIGLGLICIAAIAAFFTILNREENMEPGSDGDRVSAPDPSSLKKSHELNDIKNKSHEEEKNIAPLSEYLERITDEENQFRPASWGDEQWANFVFTHRERLAYNGEVEFYGKIVDQDGNSLSDVELMALIDYHEPDLQSILDQNDARRKKEISLTTDSNGEFSVTDQVGQSMDLYKFRKDGFKISGKRSYVYTFGDRSARPHKADRSNPVIFTMQRKIHRDR